MASIWDGYVDAVVGDGGDFSQVQALTSAALGMVVALHKVVAKLNGQLGIANLSDEIHRAFKMTKLNRMINIYDAVPTAVASFS